MALLCGYEDWYSLTRSLMDLGFRQLGDTPDSYADKAGKGVKVSADEKALVFTDTIIDSADPYPQYVRHGLAAAVSDFLVASGAGAFIKKTLNEVKTILGLGAFTTLNNVYPVGSIYISVVSTNPGTVFGMGTWAAFGAGKVPVGLNAAESEFDTVEETGGSKTQALTTAQLAAHNHPILQGVSSIYVVGKSSAVGNNPEGSNSGAVQVQITSGNTGSGTAHNNLQPYIVVYMWKRTA